MGKNDGKHQCHYEFPYNTQVSLEPIIIPQTQRWLFYKLRIKHQNVVSNHQTTLLLWQAHMNIHKVTNIGFSYNSLKHAIKTEPTKEIHLEPTIAIGLGFNSIDLREL